MDNTNNDLPSVIAAAKIEAAQRFAQEQEADAIRQAEHKRNAARVHALLTHSISHLKTAFEELQAQDVPAEIGNGKDAARHPRRSLRIYAPYKAHAPCLVFTATIHAPTPQLVWHTEFNNVASAPRTTPVEDASEFPAIIRDFIKAAIR